MIVMRRILIALVVGGTLAGAGAAGAAPLRHAGIAAKPESVYGRYVLQPDPRSGAGAGIFAPLVQLVTALEGGPALPDSGSLGLFGNQVRKGAPLVPSGIVTLHSIGSTDVAYLSNFRWEGDRRTADVYGGSTEGPVVGAFSGTLAGGVVTGTLTVEGDRTPVTFRRVEK
jgi:hypothetical protein